MISALLNGGARNNPYDNEVEDISNQQIRDARAQGGLQTVVFAKNQHVYHTPWTYLGL